MTLPLLSASEVKQHLTVLKVTDALEAALLAGVDVDRDPPRQVVDLSGGQLLIMPSASTQAVDQLVDDLVESQDGGSISRSS
jgi:hypothetical protein